MTGEICTELSKGLLGDTLGFLKKNVVMMNFDGEGPPKNPVRCFDFNKPYETKNGGAVYFPTVNGASVINGHLNVSYLPWAENSGYYIILEPDSGPDLMFTATLDGCSVGYVRAKDGALRVSHHNIQGPTGTDAAAQIRSLSFASGTFHKGDYYSKDEPNWEGEYYVEKGTVGMIYGVRKKSVWTMYAQVVARANKTSSEGFLLSIDILKSGEF
jgi:hypothetical protein